MARCGAYVLLAKYKKPFGRSIRIPINRNFYYHPYEIGYNSKSFSLSTFQANAELSITYGLKTAKLTYSVDRYMLQFEHYEEGDQYICLCKDHNYKDSYYRSSSQSRFTTFSYNIKVIGLLEFIAAKPLFQIYVEHRDDLIKTME